MEKYGKNSTEKFGIPNFRRFRKSLATSSHHTSGIEDNGLLTHKNEWLHARYGSRSKNKQYCGIYTLEKPLDILVVEVFLKSIAIVGECIGRSSSLLQISHRKLEAI